jgi:hypothetical protein
MKRRVLLVTLAMILASALTGGFFYLRYSMRRVQGEKLKADLFVMREGITKYTLDKEHAPQSLHDLINGHYWEEIPTDPFTRKKDWVPTVRDTAPSPEQAVAGIDDVHSASNHLGSNGIAYNMW